MTNKIVYLFLVGNIFFGFTQTKKSDSLQNNITYSLDETVVSSTKFPLETKFSGRSITTIDSVQLAASIGLNIGDILERYSPIIINGNNGSAGQSRGIYVRGGRSRQVVIYVDNIPIYDPTLTASEFDIRLLDKNNIENIEIMTGGSSVLYGSGAATAVINITTKKLSKTKISGAIKTTTGSNQSANDQNYSPTYFNTSANVGGTIQNFFYTTNLNYQDIGGLSAVKDSDNEYDPFYKTNALLKLGYRTKAVKASLGFNYSNYTAHYDGFDPNTFIPIDANNKTNSEERRLFGQLNYNYKNGQLSANVSYANFRRYFISNFSSNFDSELISADVFNNYELGENWKVVLGLNLRRESADNYNESLTSTDPYLNIVYTLPIGLTLNSGLRLNYHQTYGNNYVYQINPSYIISETKILSTVFASYSTSFIAPFLSQLYGTFGANPNLEPETNRTLEGGITFGMKKRFNFTTTLFKRNEENTIIYTTKYNNSEETAIITGVEIEGDLHITKQMNINFIYTFSEKDEAALLKIPKNIIKTNLSYSFPNNWNTSLYYSYYSDTTDFGNIPIAAFHLVDLNISKVLFAEKLQTTLAIKNLFNQSYLETVGYETLGRNILFSIGYNF